MTPNQVMDRAINAIDNSMRRLQSEQSKIECFERNVRQLKRGMKRMGVPDNVINGLLINVVNQE